tara:strand:- start:148151 stop:149368 length:1218 start_codon:yes stop_codon:yes gene_type:complete
MSFDIEKIRSDFPILKELVHGQPLVYLDAAATSLKPTCVIEAVTKHYQSETSNVHRGIHFLSAQATQKYEDTRSSMAKLINAKECEVIFTKGTTDSINLVANSFGEKFLNPGDVILLSTMEHHSNIVPWQLVAQKKGAKVIEVPITDIGEIDIDAYKKLLEQYPVKMVSINHISNTLGTINPVKELIQMAHAHDAYFCVDAAQSGSHLKIDVRDIDCDFLALSGHKMFGPTGTGILYGKESLLEEIPPYQGGGAMIKEVSFEKTTFNDLPEKFEAGTPNIAGVIALNKAIQYIEELGLDQIAAHEDSILRYATERIKEIEGVQILGESKNKASVLSFSIEGTHPHDIGMIVDEQGVAIRTGHHCTQPLMKRFNITASARASFGVYNNTEDVDRFIESLKKAKELL